jgi:hypothetical protein
MGRLPVHWRYPRPRPLTESRNLPPSPAPPRRYTGRPRSCVTERERARCLWCNRTLVGVGVAMAATQSTLDLSDTDSVAVARWTGPGRLDQVRVQPTDVLLGCGGVVYQPRLLELPLLLPYAQPFQPNETCRRVDDVLFSSNLAVSLALILVRPDRVHSLVSYRPGPSHCVDAHPRCTWHRIFRCRCERLPGSGF